MSLEKQQQKNTEQKKNSSKLKLCGSWALTGIFPGGGKHLGGPQKICEWGPHNVF